MKSTVTETMFHDAFHRMGRANQFSWQARSALFDYLVSMEEDMGEEMEMDVIALCCEFEEDTFENVADNYGLDVEGMGEEEMQEEVLAYLERNTCVIWHDDCRVLYQLF